MSANGTEFYALIIKWIVNIVLTIMSSFLFPSSVVVNTVKCCLRGERGTILKVMPPSLGYLCPVTTRFRILKDQSPYPNLGQIWSQFSIRASPKAWLRNTLQSNFSLWPIPLPSLLFLLQVVIPPQSLACQPPFQSLFQENAPSTGTKQQIANLFPWLTKFTLFCYWLKIA